MERKGRLRRLGRLGRLVRLGRKGENCDTWKKNQCKVSCISTSGTSLSHTHELEGKCIHLHCTFINNGPYSVMEYEKNLRVFRFDNV